MSERAYMDEEKAQTRPQEEPDFPEGQVHAQLGRQDMFLEQLVRTVDALETRLRMGGILRSRDETDTAPDKELRELLVPLASKVQDNNSVIASVSERLSAVINATEL